VKQTYRVIAGAIALGVLLEAAAIAFGWFDAISEIDKGLVIDGNYEGNAGHMLHGIVGMYLMPLLGLILLVVSFFVGVPGARKWGGIVFGAILIQVVLAITAFSVPIVGALHGINALVILGAAGRAAALTRDTLGARPSGDPGSVPSQRTGTSSTGSSHPA